MAVRWRAPGRVNLVGEHTDYNQGYALPFAIEPACAAEVTPAETAYVATSAQLGATTTLDASSVAVLPKLEADPWVRYVLGPVWVLLDSGYDVPPLHVHVDSDVPVGAGLSSSAAVVCSVLCAIDDLLGFGLDSDQLLSLARRVENDVAGAPTGGMDQLASLRAAAGHALLCDFREMTAEQVAFDPVAKGLEVLVVDTQTPHRLVDGQYAARREACSDAAVALGVGSLREVTNLRAAFGALAADDLRRYVRHVVTENERVTRTAALLRAGDLAAIGPVLSASHASLRDDFRVTVPPLDLAAETLERAGALGARMTGAGFGGSVLALVEADLVPSAFHAVEIAFAAQGWRAPRFYLARPSGGASRLSDE